MDFKLTILNGELKLIPLREVSEKKPLSSKYAAQEQIKRNKLVQGTDPLLKMKNERNKRSIKKSLKKIKKLY